MRLVATVGISSSLLLLLSFFFFFSFLFSRARFVQFFSTDQRMSSKSINLRMLLVGLSLVG